MATRSCRKRLSVKLEDEERGQIQILLSSGVQSVRVVKRAQALRLLAEGLRSPEVALAVGLTPKAVRNIGWRYIRTGLDRALYEAPRPGAAPRLTDSQAQQVIAMVCSDPPEGRARWTIRLIRRRP
jgi:putative transposase